MPSCPSCDKENKETATFCQFCGSRLVERAVNRADTTQNCLRCRSDNPEDAKFCFTCGSHLKKQFSGEKTGKHEIPESFYVSQPFEHDTAETPTLSSLEEESPVLANLICVDEEGADSRSIKVYDEVVALGKSTGLARESTHGAQITFEDEYMAAEHAIISRDTGDPHFRLRPKDSTNGVYLKIDGSAPLHSGDHIHLGRQLLKFEMLSLSERDESQTSKNGIFVWGSPLSDHWATLKQETIADTVRNVYHLVDSEVVVGRERGDIVFSDDILLSREHARIVKNGAHIRIEDMASSNGTFVRIRGAQTLRSGDMFRIGKQLIRFELG